MGGKHSKRKKEKLQFKEHQRSVKMVLVGDGAVGKTSLLYRHTTQSFPCEYVPTVFDNHSFNYQFGKDILSIEPWDTAGGEEYARLRVLSYPETDVFVVLFSIVNRHSFENVRENWFPEILEHGPGTPCFLVGTKCDLTEDQGVMEDLISRNIEPITFEEGKQMADEMGAAGYVECSARENYNVGEVFEQAIQTGMLVDPPLPFFSRVGLSVKRAQG